MVLQGRNLTFLVTSSVVLLLNVSSFVSVWLKPGNQMGRQERRARERKRAAASCRTLDSFLPPAKRNHSTSDSAHSIPAASIELEATASQDASVVAPHPSTSVADQDTSVADPEPGSQPKQVYPPSALSEQDASTVFLDIGDVVVKCTTDEEVVQSLRSLPPSEKYVYLHRLVKPEDSFTFPTTFTGGCNRSFLARWLKEHAWLCYSIKLDGVFCMPCALFNGVSGVAVKGKLVTSPFRMWQKKSERFKAHETSAYHYESMVLVADLKRRNEHPEEAITAVVDKAKAANIARNRNILKSISQAVLHCGQQCIVLHSDAEKLDTPGNPGNFLALLTLIAVHDVDLRTHLESPQMCCVTYMSRRTQKEIIEVLGKHIILRGIVEEIEKAPSYTMADEVTSHNFEHLAVCVRFVDENSEIREEFLAFTTLDRITGE